MDIERLSLLLTAAQDDTGNALHDIEEALKLADAQDAFVRQLNPIAAQLRDTLRRIEDAYVHAQQLSREGGAA